MDRRLFLSSFLVFFCPPGGCPGPPCCLSQGAGILCSSLPSSSSLSISVSNKSGNKNCHLQLQLQVGAPQHNSPMWPFPFSAKSVKGKSDTIPSSPTISRPSFPSSSARTLTLSSTLFSLLKLSALAFSLSLLVFILDLQWSYCHFMEFLNKQHNYDVM